VRGVRCADGDLFATAAEGNYAIARGVLALSGSEPGSLTPHVVNDQLSIDAARIDITLEGPLMQAAGSVKSVLTPKKGADTKTESTAKLPSMLKDDQPVNVASNELSYDGPADRAVYTGSALLWQGETSVKGSSITINGKNGDLSAAGPVTTSTMLLQEDEKGVKKKVSSIGTAKEFVYVDALRRATYTGEAHITGPQGDLTSPRVELFLKPSGDELERAEAYDGVTLQGDGRKTTGIRLTFFGADQRYVVTGTPVTIVDECGRETTGRTLTFFRATDRIVVDGNEQIRTQTRGKSNCS
jgi:lipopolysaccharide export system protein LptA